MTNHLQLSSSVLPNSLRAPVVTLGVALALAMVTMQPVQAQTFQVLHNFTDGADGATPLGIAIDAHGNLYGTTFGPGNCVASGVCGGVFKLSRSGSGWTINSLYHFQGGMDGSHPHAGVTVASDGTLYGTTAAGGGGSCDFGGIPGCGTVYRLQPPPTRCVTALCPWHETVLHSFANDPIAIPYATVTFDSADNMYGTALGGIGAGGGVFQLTPSQGGWTFNILHTFTGNPDGANPYDALTLDPSGTLFGTTMEGGLANDGTVFDLVPSGSGWTEHVLYSFTFDSGFETLVGLAHDQAGNLYGVTSMGGPRGEGTDFELSPSNGGYSFSVIYDKFPPMDGGGAGSRLIMDQAGNLYGTAGTVGAHGQGMVYKLSPTEGGGWILTDLHDFNGSDGRAPQGDIVLDANGNLYGVTFEGGADDFGTVWEITP